MLRAPGLSPAAQIGESALSVPPQALFIKRSPPSLRRGYHGKLKFGILPVSTFCSGHTFFTQGMPFKLNLDPYVVHATFQFSGTPGKRFRFREALLWDVRPPPEHVDSCIILAREPYMYNPGQGTKHYSTCVPPCPA